MSNFDFETEKYCTRDIVVERNLLWKVCFF